ncbi:MAG: N-terminal half of MaoC dehydratase [Chloroflexi bacterium]|jgi:hypothetical protein|nr:MAG: N-terminal half of MaoC dehydratase [Chloroflexota bacterium]
MINHGFTPGRAFESDKVTLNSNVLGDYRSVIEATAEVYNEDYVPTIALAALGIRTLLSGLGVPPGAVHVSQELQSHRAAKSGDTVYCHGEVTQSSRRSKGGEIVILEFKVMDSEAALLLDGRTTLIIFEQE